MKEYNWYKEKEDNLTAFCVEMQSGPTVFYPFVHINKNAKIPHKIRAVEFGDYKVKETITTHGCRVYV